VPKEEKTLGKFERKNEKWGKLCWEGKLVLFVFLGGLVSLNGSTKREKKKAPVEASLAMAGEP